MAISYITNALGATNSTTSFSITLPTTVANDILILEFTHRGTGNGTIGGTSVTTDGLTWALKHSQLYASSAFSGKTYWTRATGDHATRTVTGSSLTNSCAAILTVYRGCVTASDPLADATIVGEQNASANETQAQITTATAGATGAFTWTQTDGASGSWAYALVPLASTNVTVNATGTSSTGAVGSVSLSAGATKASTGTLSTGAVGSVTLAGNAGVAATSTEGTGAVGTVTVDIPSPNVTVVLTGTEGVGAFGSVTTTAQGLFAATGVFSTGAVGTVSLTGDCVVGCTGLVVFGYVGNEDVDTYVPNGNGALATAPYQWTSCRGGRGRR